MDINAPEGPALSGSEEATTSPTYRKLRNSQNYLRVAGTRTVGTVGGPDPL